MDQKNATMKAVLKISLFLTIGALIELRLAASDVFAVTVPAAGDFAYDIYQIGVQKILQGPIGFVVGVGAIAMGAVQAMQSKVFAAVPCILGGAALLKADAIVQTLGAMF